MLLNIAKEALKQIDDKKYINNITSRGVNQSNVIKYAMVFYDLQCLITTWGMNVFWFENQVFL